MDGEKKEGVSLKTLDSLSGPSTLCGSIVIPKTIVHFDSCDQWAIVDGVKKEGVNVSAPDS